MIAICSDLDETPTSNVYFSTSEFLNSTAQTQIGPGQGLEIGNSIYFYMPDDQFAYYNTDEESRRKVHALVQSGHIDCFHSYGDLANCRSQAAKALDDFQRNGSQILVWIDHAKARTNIGSDIMQGCGDNPLDDAYHTDLTTAYGVRYFWLGRVTSHLGQDIRYRPLTILDKRRPLKSARTAAKDWAKQCLSFSSRSMYRMHRHNHLTRRISFAKDEIASEFIRSNPHPAGVSSGETAEGIATVLSDRNLSAIVSAGGKSIIYTHLGKRLCVGGFFSEAARDAFARLKQYQSDGKILVTTTRRLLEYSEALDSISVRKQSSGDRTILDIQSGPDLDISGLTIYWQDSMPVVRHNGTDLSEVRCNPADETGQRSISVSWRPLQWPL